MVAPLAAVVRGQVAQVVVVVWTPLAVVVGWGGQVLVVVVPLVVVEVVALVVVEVAALVVLVGQRRHESTKSVALASAHTGRSMYSKGVAAAAILPVLIPAVRCALGGVDFQ